MMPRVGTQIARLRRDERGAMLVETAIVAPVLLLMSMGAFQVSEVIAKQTELQGAAAEASGIALAAPPVTADQRMVLKDIIVDSTRLAADKVVISEKFRCGESTAYVDAEADCVDVKVAHYILIQLSDTFTPAWTEWGFGDPIEYQVNRYVMVKQS